MNWLGSLWDWLSAQSGFWWWAFAASVAVFVVSPLVATWLVVRLPSDYFVERKRQQSAWQLEKPAFSLVLAIGRNLLGVVLLVAGIVMLLTPGQGLLSIAVGLMLVDFPGKSRLLRWLAGRPAVWRSMNWLRRRAGKPPLDRM